MRQAQKLANILQSRAVDYCNVINDQIVANVIMVRYNRDMNGYIPSLHILRHSKLGRSIGCGCKYCLTLQRYVSSRLILHRLKKQRYWDFLQPPYDTIKKLNDAILKQNKYCFNLRNDLVVTGSAMKVPSSVKKRKKYERS